MNFYSIGKIQNTIKKLIKTRVWEIIVFKTIYRQILDIKKLMSIFCIWIGIDVIINL